MSVKVELGSSAEVTQGSEWAYGRRRKVENKKVKKRKIPV